MPDADFEVLRRAWAMTSARDEDGFRRELHPAIEVVPFGAAMEGKRYRGPDEVIGWLREEIYEHWDVFETIPEEFERVGDKLLVTGHWHARAMESGVELNRPASWVVEVRDGKIVYWRAYTDAAEARRDVGLDG